jgi:hypothetical protein
LRLSDTPEPLSDEEIGRLKAMLAWHFEAASEWTQVDTLVERLLNEHARLKARDDKRQKAHPVVLPLNQLPEIEHTDMCCYEDCDQTATYCGGHFQAEIDHGQRAVRELEQLKATLATARERWLRGATVGEVLKMLESSPDASTTETKR